MEVMPDHVHIWAELSPKYAIASEITMLKGVTARIIRRDYGGFHCPLLWNDSFWSDSYFLKTTGGANIEMLEQYIQQQGIEKPKRK